MDLFLHGDSFSLCVVSGCGGVDGSCLLMNLTAEE